MAFIQPCFIRKNNFQLRLALHNLGYENARNDTVGNCIATTTTTQHYNTISQYYVDSNDLRITWKENRIDCGTNEELFLALAALRDDSDYMQWFTYNNYWHKCLDNNFSKYAADWILFPDADVWHKATIEEIMEHFKNK